MKVLLREHVDNLGDRGEIVSVARGFARNYLLPKGLAMEATPGNMKMLDHQRRVWESKETKERGEAEVLARHLATIDLTVTMRAGEAGTLYGSVTTPEIARLLEAKGVRVDRRRIHLDEPIKHLGDYQVPVRIHREVTGSVRVHVVAEAGSRTPAEPLEEPPDIDDEDDRGRRRRR